MAAHQDFKQELEARGLEDQMIEATAAHHEVAGHGIFSVDMRALDGPGDPDRSGGEELPGAAPFAERAAMSVAAADCQIAAGIDSGEELREKLRGVLEIGVHHSEDGGVGVLPAIENGSGQSTLAFADEEADAGVFKRNGGDDFSRIVWAFVVYDKNLVGNIKRVKDGADVPEQATDVFGLRECGDDERQFLMGRPLLALRRGDHRCPSLFVHVGSFYHCDSVQSEGNYTELPRLKRNNSLVDLLLILVFTVVGFAVMGYHPGVEDDSVYLTAVKANLQPALYPHDSDFFRLQLQATQFDGWMGHFVKATGISVAWAGLVWQLLSVVFILWACLSIARHLFPEARAQWAGVALVAAMLTLPVAGTALSLVDQYLHPRGLATALILIAVTRIMAGRYWQAVPLLLVSFALHPIMAALGISFCFILSMAMLEPVRAWVRALRGGRSALKVRQGTEVALAAPLAWMFDPPNPIWRKAVAAKSYFQLSQWAWYEWLGALAPLVLFWLLWRMARKRGETKLARFALAVLVYGVFQLVVAVIMLETPALIRLTPLQPMRFLHLIYFFMVLIGGCLLGKYLLKASVWRWALFLLVANVSMFAAQRQVFSASLHLELPGRVSANQWLQAFAWVRQNTPTDAYFAVGAQYMAAPGEDFHSFRALAERSQLADSLKDTAVVTQVPELGPAWERQTEAQAGWAQFKLKDFERLKSDFGVDWVLVNYPATAGLDCRWHNRALAVCVVP